MRHDCTARIGHPKQVRLQRFEPLLRRSFNEWTNGAENTRCADCNVDMAEVDPHAIDGRVDLLKIANVGADAERVASAMFDFKMRRVEFSFAAGQKSYA